MPVYWRRGHGEGVKGECKVWVWSVAVSPWIASQSADRRPEVLRPRPLWNVISMNMEKEMCLFYSHVWYISNCLRFNIRKGKKHRIYIHNLFWSFDFICYEVKQKTKQKKKKWLTELIFVMTLNCKKICYSPVVYNQPSYKYRTLENNARLVKALCSY